MKGSANAAVSKLEVRCIKMQLPNGRVVDILAEVIEGIQEWLQNDILKPESGGYILGYKHYKTGNISLEYITPPQKMDTFSRVSFQIRDKAHKVLIDRGIAQKSYYMGVWHTHPQTIPSPSGTDITDWKSTLRMDKTGCEYAFFLIAGTDAIRVWIGDFRTQQIVEIQECKKKSGLYKKV